MKRWKPSALVLAAAIALGAGAAQAHAHGRGDGPGFGRGQSFDPAAAERRLSALKSELKITAAQESAWGAYTDEVKRQVADMQALRGSVAGKAPASVPERLDMRSELMKKRLDSFEKLAAATKDLYAALTPEQKSVADQRLARGFGAGHGGRRHR
jgi:hypothetical protein